MLFIDSNTEVFHDLIRWSLFLGFREIQGRLLTTGKPEIPDG